MKVYKTKPDHCLYTNKSKKNNYPRILIIIKNGVLEDVLHASQPTYNVIRFNFKQLIINKLKKDYNFIKIKESKLNLIISFSFLILESSDSFRYLSMQQTTNLLDDKICNPYKSNIPKYLYNLLDSKLTLIYYNSIDYNDFILSKYQKRSSATIESKYFIKKLFLHNSDITSIISIDTTIKSNRKDPLYKRYQHYLKTLDGYRSKLEIYAGEKLPSGYWLLIIRYKCLLRLSGSLMLKKPCIRYIN